jgi:hypothetical protein
LRQPLKQPIHFAFKPARGSQAEREGAMMRLTIALAAITAPALAAPASAATIVVLADPMTMERRTVIVDPNGPDRAYLCMLPPATAGCQAIRMKRIRR